MLKDPPDRNNSSKLPAGNTEKLLLAITAASTRKLQDLTRMQPSERKGQQQMVSTEGHRRLEVGDSDQGNL